MLTKVETLEDLIFRIDEDLKTNTPNAVRYPARLIFVHKRETFQKLIKYLEKVSKTIEINSLCENKDKWITPDSIKERINLITKTSTFIPLGEFLRFSDSIMFSSMLNSLFEIENHSENKRIYFPILGMKEEFIKNFLERFHRKNALIPMWEINESYDKKIEVFQLRNNLQTQLPIIKTTSEWMQIWKRTDSQKLISKSSVLEFLYEQFSPDPIFNFVPIDNYKQLISKIHSIDIPFDYKNSDFEYWERLNKEVESNKISSFSELLSDQLNTKRIDLNVFAFLTLWFRSDDNFSKWLLTNYFILQKEESYLKFIFTEINEFTDKTFLRILWIFPFNKNIPDEMLAERKKILKFVHNDLQKSFSFIENDISDYLQNIPKDNVKLFVTDISFSEQKFILKYQQEFWLENINQNDKEIVYPDLFNYLNWDSISIDTKEKWYINYFKEYCFSKVTNKKSIKLKEILNEKNRDSNEFYKWYYSLETAEIHSESEVFWIDGLGSEWLPFIQSYLNKISKNSKYKISNYKFVRVNIPSTTNNNRFENTHHILDLDKFNHSESTYLFPDNLIKQFDLIKNILYRIIETAKGKKISIVSDHGFSFLCRKEFGNFKTLNFENDNHEGRCMFTDESIKSDKDFLSHKIETGIDKGKSCLIALNHKSLNKIPAREVHGGATPEEVVVPYIELTKIEQNINYLVKLRNNKLNIKKLDLEFSIHPTPIAIPFLEFEEKIMNVRKRNNCFMTFQLSDVNIGNYECSLNIDNKKYKFDFEIVGGLTENELF